MSAFDPALLEGKDRSELAAIAESLGEKPGARAKKADIVALIMRLVGAEAEHEGADAGEAAAAATDTAHSEPEAATGEEADADQDGDGEGDGDGDEAHDEHDDHDDHDERAEDRAGGGQQGQQGGPSQQGQGGPGGEDVEPANRRRRRRGRDRRPEGEEPSQYEPTEVSGMVELREEGYGFLRLHGFHPSRDDAYISVKQTRQFGLRTGDLVAGRCRPALRNEKNPALVQVDSVNGFQAHNQPSRVRFDDLTAVFPDERLTLEGEDPGDLTARIVDLVAPIGKGQRGLVVSPPKAGKTTVLKDVVRAIEANHPDVEVLVVLVDERPEEVTDWKRSLERGTVAASTFDRPAEEHTAVADLVIERAKRLVEQGRDVVVVLDGLTRLARAHNLAAPTSGRTLAGGLEASALYPVKRFFGAARHAEEGGSLTILATIAVETGSATDEAIFDELHGAANLELRLDRRLAERRRFPAIDVDGSSTRNEEQLFEPEQLQQAWALRRLLGQQRDESGAGAAGLELLVERLASTKTNAELLAQVAKGD
jgi:transcription termination factor Rho